MSRPPGTLTIRLAELRPVVDAVELTKGLRGGIVGGKVRSARLVPADGGMTVELFGSSTFVPVASGTLDRELVVDANLLAGFLRNSTRAFRPAETVSLNVGPDQVIGTCGTLKLILHLSATPPGQRQGSRPPRAQSAKDLRLEEAEGVGGRGLRGNPGAPEGPGPRDTGNRQSASATGPTETDANLWDADSELHRIEEIDRMLKSAKRQRPDYDGIRVLIYGWMFLLALVEIVFGGDMLAWVVVMCLAGFLAEMWSDHSAKRKWDRMLWEKEAEISEIQKRIELLGYTARQEPSRWVLKPKSKKNAPDA